MNKKRRWTRIDIQSGRVCLSVCAPQLHAVGLLLDAGLVHVLVLGLVLDVGLVLLRPGHVRQHLHWWQLRSRATEEDRI